MPSIRINLIPLSQLFFLWVAAENYTRLCKIKADLSTLPLSPNTNPAGETYYRAEYDIVLSFGLTELKAQVAWRDDKVGCSSFLFYFENTSLAMDCRNYRELNRGEIFEFSGNVPLFFLIDYQLLKECRQDYL